MRDVLAELKALRLYGWPCLSGTGVLEVSSGIRDSGLAARAPARGRAYRPSPALRSALSTAGNPFTVHRDLAGFDFEQSKVGGTELETRHARLHCAGPQRRSSVALAPASRTLATALGVDHQHGKRVRFYRPLIWSICLSRRRAASKAGKLAFSLLRMDLVILDELGLPPFSQGGGASLKFHRLEAFTSTPA